MTTRIVGLYALCDLHSAGGASANPDSRLDFTVDEFAKLSEGQPVLLRELGWTSVPSTGGAATLALYLNEEQVVGSVRNVVLPDDAETSNEEHPWHQLAATLTEMGFSTTADELRDLPYEIKLTPRLRARLSTPEA
ncbi:hypothetical protein OG792_12110 [Micromonospora sp. NBC_01699]|uniref:hypothetical protein n=1 Tax=Micromonospora sp. NBC_01699 TaxID=2975984 RepID=UPI002E2EF419|nr:hypothetical protein [Micromonospora sp. NBC_01699]